MSDIDRMHDLTAFKKVKGPKGQGKCLTSNVILI